MFIVTAFFRRSSGRSPLRSIQRYRAFELSGVVDHVITLVHDPDVTSFYVTVTDE